jgi:hypothetical protein
MDRVSDVFAFALTQPDLCSGLFFHDRAEVEGMRGISDQEWQALEAARPHLTFSINCYLREAHRSMRDRAARSRSLALERVRRARYHPGREPPWQYAQLYLASSYRASVLFGFSDDVEGALRPYATLWARYGLLAAVRDAAARVEPGDDVIRLDHHQSVAWYLPTPLEGDSFSELGQAAADLVWPAARRLCERLNKQAKTA